jgi:2-C-methyl-D-erythritol 2,4-cyclodiphosphate synthase
MITMTTSSTRMIWKGSLARRKVVPDDIGQLGRLRVASGVDVHPFVEGRPLIIGGVQIEHTHGLEGHSDADVVAHAVTDAVLGGAGMGDIGGLFPSDDPSLHGANSMDLLKQAMAKVCDGGHSVISVDVVVIAQVPRISPHRDAIEAALAATLDIDPSRVSVRSTTTDHLGFVGRREGIGALATALVLRG